MFRGGNSHISSSVKKLEPCFFLDNVIARSLKLCKIIALLGVYIFVVCLMILTLFQGNRCVRNLNCELYVLDSILACWSLDAVWLLHTLRKSCTVWIVWLASVQGRLFTCFWFVKCLGLLETFICNKCKTLHDGTPHWALPVYYTLAVTLTLFQGQSSVKQF